MSGIQIDTGENTKDRPYKIGAHIELMFQTDTAAADVIGNTITVEINDAYDNLIDTLQAIRISPIDGLYVIEYVIPFLLSTFYNPLKADESKQDPTLFYLKDKWIFPDLSFVEFPFTVSRAYDQPVSDNMEYFLRLDPRLLAQDGSTVDNTVVHFTSQLVPYYSSVQAVRDTFIEAFKGYDNFAIARKIVAHSQLVDYHMKPDFGYIKPDNQGRLTNAITGFVTNYVAKDLLSTILSTTSEEKMLDTFKISRTTANKDVISVLDAHIRAFSLIIWAGGKDTPFISKTYQKGLYDPNRTQANRANLDTSGWYPWVNTSSSNYIVNIDGSNVEVRGERTISFTSGIAPYNGYGGGLDGGDVGYLSRI